MYLKKKIGEFLSTEKIEFEDLGANEVNITDDYPDIAQKISQKVLENEENRGILICKSGQGVCIASNRFKNIRAGQAFNEEMAETGRNDDDLNILCLSSQWQNEEQSKKIIKKFLETKFNQQEKFIRRINKLDKRL
ncbi:ribose-5-phosphate isomerase [Candidatus Berkelbacteria bacterium CG_4_10_14_0_8_um_filter_35_9_33_8]|nr:MAG: ribose-5-phosphate isomerase [Candidatus Berkelbacteria bacterium CG_4_10_14_0_8_um_filter_35_9_33_8]